MDTKKNITALKALRQYLPETHAALGLAPSAALDQWQSALDIKLLPRMDERFPLVAAVCGGGSAGKSTLFNSLIGQSLSPTGGRAGINRRVLAALSPAHRDQKGFMQALTDVFNGRMQPMTDPAQLTTPGDPVFWSGPGALPNMVLLDTPDIDTGARGEYHNREQARLSMESADLFIYIFTNATYNNRDNTDFLARMFTGMGIRPCYLVYRVYSAYDTDEVRSHALTVARNIYGDDYQSSVLGIFRADEDNAVAAGQKPMQVRSMAPGGSDLQHALADLDSISLRGNLLRSMSAEAVSQAGQILAALQSETDTLQQYRQTLESIQAQSVQRALSHFPTDRVLGRFAKIWLATDPRHIKIMRRTGQVIEWPIKTLGSAVMRLKAPTHSPASARRDETPAAQLDIDLLNAASFLYQQAAADHLKGDDRQVSAPAAVLAAQESLRQKDWKTALTHIRAQRETILSWSVQLEKDLKQLADQLRRKMGLWDRTRQTFAALLNVLPATAAITYVLSTGDPVGATGIKIKLTGLLGLHDLYALIAIPATAGLKKADQQQLTRLLEPVARTWLAHKFSQVQALFEAQITGRILSDVRCAQTKAGDLLARSARELSRAKESV